MSRAQCWLDSDLLRQLRLAAERERFVACTSGYRLAVDGEEGTGGVSAETLLHIIVSDWMATKPYAALQQRLDAARKAEEYRFWADQKQE